MRAGIGAESGASVFSRLGRIPRAELLKDIAAGRVDSGALDRALGRVSYAIARQALNESFRAALSRHDEARAALKRFRLVAREMHGFVSEATGRSNGAAQEMMRLLDAVEWHFACWAEPGIPFPLVEKPRGRMLQLPAMKLGAPRAAHRPPAAWKPAARQALRHVGVRAKLASQVVAELSRQGNSRTS